MAKIKVADTLNVASHFRASILRKKIKTYNGSKLALESLPFLH